jgi:hypothetical protein
MSNNFTIYLHQSPYQLDEIMAYAMISYVCPTHNLKIFPNFMSSLSHGSEIVSGASVISIRLGPVSSPQKDLTVIEVFETIGEIMVNRFLTLNSYQSDAKWILGKISDLITGYPRSPLPIHTYLDQTLPKSDLKTSSDYVWKLIEKELRHFATASNSASYSLSLDLRQSAIANRRQFLNIAINNLKSDPKISPSPINRILSSATSFPIILDFNMINYYGFLGNFDFLFNEYELDQLIKTTQSLPVLSNYTVSLDNDLNHLILENQASID